MNKTFYIEILGCKVNAYEAESVRNSLIRRGYSEVGQHDSADIFVIFTCAVTNTAESKTRKKIHQLVRLNDRAIMVVVGCYAQIHQDILSEDDDIDILVGSSHKDRIADMIGEFENEGRKICLFEDISKKAPFDALETNSFAHMTRAYLKIQDGCNQFCSYCIIPYSRGRERSIEFDEAIRQARELSRYHKEIVLTGIHTGRFGNGTDHNLTDLIRKLIEIEELKRIRISSIEITEITDELIGILATEPKLARHLHIPLQSGNDRQLAMMNRPYTTDEFSKRVDYIRERVPGISISTDLIVGFPGETEEDFADTVKFIRDNAFSFIHCFPYARKNGTVAASMKGQLENRIKKERVRKIAELSEQLYRNYMERFIGSTLSVIVEGKGGGTQFGHSSEYLPVHIDGDTIKNTIIDVKVIKLNNSELIGKVVEE